jgi:diphthamide synthase (EF-2-diphthine--ammonia ligase)
VSTVAFQWSGGKDSVLGLGRLMVRDDVRVDRLVTTTNLEDAGSTVHEVLCTCSLPRRNA